MENWSNLAVFISTLAQGHVLVRFATRTSLSGGDHGYRTIVFYFCAEGKAIALIISVAVLWNFPKTKCRKHSRSVSLTRMCDVPNYSFSVTSRNFSGCCT